MLASAFSAISEEPLDALIYAAGVSNSTCEDAYEFNRERARLLNAMDGGADHTAFVYFGTCSVYDPQMSDSTYVQHKCAMEMIVKKHPNYLIVRLPQIAGKTNNPHTLLNYLHSRVSRSERFPLWRNARRNIIDIDDVVKIVGALLRNPIMRKTTVNVCNSRSYSIGQIVAEMERVTGKTAVTDVLEKGVAYEIDPTPALALARASGITFDDQYLSTVVDKYYRAKAGSS